VDDYQLETGSKPDIVAIDYLGYWAQSFHANSRYEKVTDAVMSLKACAKDLKVPFIAPHQVSRGAEFGTEIDLSDSRDSGAIEETADFAFGMWNEDTRKGVNPEDRKGEVNLRIIKSRHGGKGHKITMQFGYCTLVMAPHEDPVATAFARDELAYAARGESWEDAMTRHKTGRKDGDLLSFTV
jgi:replicative DNA helicase